MSERRYKGVKFCQARNKNVTNYQIKYYQIIYIWITILKKKAKNFTKNKDNKELYQISRNIIEKTKDFIVKELKNRKNIQV